MASKLVELDLMDRNLTILIAEDSEDYALILQNAIKTLGWKNPIRVVRDAAGG